MLEHSKSAAPQSAASIGQMTLGLVQGSRIVRCFRELSYSIPKLAELAVMLEVLLDLRGDFARKTSFMKLFEVLEIVDVTVITLFSAKCCLLIHGREIRHVGLAEDPRDGLCQML